MPRVPTPRGRHGEPTICQKMMKAKSSPLATINKLLPSYLLLVTLFTDFNFCRADTIFALPDIMLEILVYCNWYSVISLSRTCVHGREIAQAAVQGPLRPLLEPFIPSKLFVPFMGMLNDLGGGIIGSIPRLLLAQNAVFHMCMIKRGDASFHAYDLNVVVPYGRLEKCRSWFKRCGFTSWANMDISAAFLSTVTVFTASICSLLTGQASAWVMTSKSAHGIFQVVLSSPITAQTNLITPSRVYSVYPNLIHRFDSLKTDHHGLQIVQREEWAPCYGLKSNNMHWRKPCGPHCPAPQRRTHGDQGIAAFHWDNIFAERTSSKLNVDPVLSENILSQGF